MATIVFTQQADFTPFSLGRIWNQRTNVFLETVESTDYLGRTYDSAYFLDYQADDFSDGRLRLYGTGMVQNASGVITGGTVHAIRDFYLAGFAGDEQFRMTDLNVSAADLHAALRSGVQTTRTFLSVLLAGNDLMQMSEFADHVFAGKGQDTMVGNGGADVLSGQDGFDFIRGGYGNDSLYGVLGDDILIGGPNADVLVGGKGNDVLTGGTGTDRFEFRAGDGQDIVRDWNDGIDRLRIYTPSEGSTAPVTFLNLANGNVRLTVLDLEITIVDAQRSDFSILRSESVITLF